MADVQYAIDIAAKLSGGDATVAEIDEISRSLAASSKLSAVYDDALTRLAGELDGARAATAAANAELAEGRANYAELERAALRAAQAAERAAMKGAVPPEVQARVAATARAVHAYAGELSMLEGRAAAAAASQAKVVQTMRNAERIFRRAKDTVGDAATKMSTFRGALGDAGGSIGAIGEQMLFPLQAFVDMREYFGTTAAAATVAVVGYVALTAAVVALGVAAVATAGYVGYLGVKLADSARSAGLAAEAAQVLHPQLAGVRGAISDLVSETTQSAPALRKLALSLSDAGVSASDLPRALRAAATAEQAAAGAADVYIAKMRAGKLSVDQFASAVSRDLGGIAARNMLSLENQGARFQRLVGELFGGLKIEPVLAGLNTLVSMFDENTTSGRVMKAAFEGIFGPLVASAQTAAYVIEAFALGVMTAGLKIYIALKPAIKYVTELLGFSDFSLEDALDLAASAGELLAYGIVALVAGFIALNAILALPIALIGALAAGFVAAGFAITMAARTAFDSVVAAVSNAFAALSPYVSKALTVGGEIMAGLAAGITASASAVIGAITGAVGGAIKSAKKLLGIKSPSKVFAEIGGYTAEGFAGGVEAGAGDVEGAYDSLLAAPRMSEASSAPAAAPSRASGPTISGVTINISGVEGAADIAPRLADALLRLLEGDAAMAGAS